MIKWIIQNDIVRIWRFVRSLKWMNVNLGESLTVNIMKCGMMLINYGVMNIKTLPKIKIGEKEYFIDGKLLQLRNVENPHQYINCVDNTIGGMVCDVQLIIDKDTGKVVSTW